MGLGAIFTSTPNWFAKRCEALSYSQDSQGQIELAKD